ncbi:MAG: rubrerythrin family protein [Halobacteriota archaeon]
MNPTTLLDDVTTANSTALSRLGSSKALYAETNGELDAERVRHAAAIAEDAARETFQAWASDESNADAAEAFETIAEQEADHYETVAESLESPPSAAAVDDVPAVQLALRDLDGTIERVGGLMGRCLVAKKSKEQYTGYFVGDADPQTAQLFRELGADVDDQLDRTLELLGAVCVTDAEYERAGAAATAAIQAAYEAYTDTLESMGVNPKPVC